MRKLLIFIALAFNLSALAAQDTLQRVQYDNFSMGIGIGLDYGGIGANVLIYPQRSIGVFGACGYNFAGIGFNGGLKLRLITSKQGPSINPYIIGMYGYNTAYHVSRAKRYDKIFYGFSAGAGFDTPVRPNKSTYWSFALIVPFRSPEAMDYFDYLSNIPYFSKKSDLLPFAISIGFHLK